MIVRKTNRVIRVIVGKATLELWSAMIKNIMDAYRLDKN